MRADSPSNLNGYSSPEISLGAFGSFLDTACSLDRANLRARRRNILNSYY